MTLRNGSNHVGVVGVGVGVVGAGVAHALASRGHDVVLVDIDAAALDRARASIRDGARLARLSRRGANPAPAASRLARIHFTRDPSELHAAAIVIENVTEDLAVKLGVYRELDAICSAECVFAANTSAIAITTIAAATRRPERVVGVHFMTPVPLIAFRSVEGMVRLVLRKRSR